MKANRKSLYSLGFAFAIVIGVMPTYAGIQEIFLNRCKAFGIELPSAPVHTLPVAEAVFEKANAEFVASSGSPDVLHLVVRAAIKELANRPEWNQSQKIRFWYEIKDLLSVRARRSLTSDEFAGRDGSVVFQGAHEGFALIIKLNGDVYRGAFDPPLELHAKAVWEPDYTGFTLLKPQVDSSKTK